MPIVMLELIIQKVFETPGIPSNVSFRGWLEAVLKSRRQNAQLTLRLVDSNESQQLNLQYRDKDQPTNVLAFPAEHDLPAGVPAQLQAEANQNLGDLVICVPLVADEAKAQGKQLDDHWAHLVTHGCLHLLGYDHLDDAQAEEMEALEVKILAAQGIPNPYKLPN